MATPLAKALGWFSIGLGLPQAVAPDAVLRLAGIADTDRNRLVMRAIGGRELGAAAGILPVRRPTAVLWGRVAGDALDLGLLAAARRSTGNDRRRVTMAIAAVAGVTALDVLAALRHSVAPDRSRPEEDSVQASSAVTIRKPPEEVYRYWRDLQNLPTFMWHLESVSVDGDRKSHWVAKGPVGTKVEWDAEIVQDNPGQLITWRSMQGSSVETKGAVRFSDAPAGQGTEVHVELEYTPPGGPIGAAVAKLFGEEPGQQVSDDLRRFKQVLETGEVVRSDGAPEGVRTKNIAHQDDAHPKENA